VTTSHDARLADKVVIVVGDDGGRVGAAVAALEARGARVAAFVGDPSIPDVGDALAEMAAELFPDPP
jgi:NAD(P)-dependent dehydrogenase (short-subunit alcohol dehydrogenase family)